MSFVDDELIGGVLIDPFVFLETTQDGLTFCLKSGSSTVFLRIYLRGFEKSINQAGDDIKFHQYRSFLK